MHYKIHDVIKKRDIWINRSTKYRCSIGVHAVFRRRNVNLLRNHGLKLHNTTALNKIERTFYSFPSLCRFTSDICKYCLSFNNMHITFYFCQATQTPNDILSKYKTLYLHFGNQNIFESIPGVERHMSCV